MKRIVPLLALFGALVVIAPAQATKALDKKELAMLKALQTEQAAAKAKYEKSPKDAKLKKAYVQATFKLAEAQLVSPALTPKEKYPSALRNYRTVVKLDPKNTAAKERIATIEAIYKSMGRPIPPN